MHALGVATVEDAERLVQASTLSHIKIGLSDVDGVMLGKYVRRDKFLAALRGGLAFCDVVFGWDLDDQLYDNTKYTGWHTAYPDAKLRIVPSTCRRLPLEQGPGGEDMLLFLAEFEGPAADICPRRLLHRTLDRAAGMGFEVYAALEYEFFMFRETPHSVRAKHYRDMENWTPGNFGYSVLRSTVQGDFYRKLLDMCERMDMPIEGLHTETGPGVLEAAIAVDQAAAAGDKAFLFKTFTKALASGLYGIEQGLEPEPMVQGNAYTQQFPEHLRLPTTLWEAAQRLRQSEAARELFGAAFVEHYAATREWEERQFRRHVTDWELARYFEII